MTIQAIKDRLDAAREAATKDNLPTRRKDCQLYALLANCMGICEEILRDGLEDELRNLLRVSVDARNPSIWGQGRGQSNNGRGRRYVENGSDAYVLVCRYVLGESDTRANLSRYAVALREAAKRQIGASSLAAWLADNGGCRALYQKGRQRSAEGLNVSTLRLSAMLLVPASGPFSLQLQWNAATETFDVIGDKTLP